MIRQRVLIAKALVAMAAILAVALTVSCSGGGVTETLESTVRDSASADGVTTLTGSNSDGSTATEPGIATDAATTTGLETDFSFTLYQGEGVLGASVVQVSDLLNRPTVVNFWAGLCPPCREEMPHFQEFYDEFEERINFVGVDVGQFTNLGSQDDAKELLADLNVTYPAGFTEDGQAVREYVTGMPTTVFITPQGDVFRSWTGYLSKNKLTEITEEMLALES